MVQNPDGSTSDQTPHNVPPQQPTPQTYLTDQQGVYIQGREYRHYQPVVAGPNHLTLNYWLSVFFTIIPATIFYYTEKNKDPRAYQFHKANLYFSITRFLLTILLNVLAIISGLDFAILFSLAITVILFGMHMSAAIIVNEKYYSGANERPLPLWPRLK